MIKQCLLFAFLSVSVGLSLAESFSTTTNWAVASAAARKNHTPILVVFESETCGYCTRLKHEILESLPDTFSQPLPLIKEFDIYTRGKITDFNGDPIRSRRFKERYHIYAVPTLIILAPDGTPLSEPIVGYNSQDEYRELLLSSLIASYNSLDLGFPDH
jgi:thioredoxin-related protein